MPPSLLRTKKSSRSARLSAVTYDLGHVVSEAFFLAHTNVVAELSSEASHPQRRFRSRPDFRQTSHLQPAWLEN